MQHFKLAIILKIAQHERNICDYLAERKTYRSAESEFPGVVPLDRNQAFGARGWVRKEDRLQF